MRQQQRLAAANPSPGAWSLTLPRTPGTDPALPRSPLCGTLAGRPMHDMYFVMFMSALHPHERHVTRHPSISDLAHSYSPCDTRRSKPAHLCHDDRWRAHAGGGCATRRWAPRGGRPISRPALGARTGPAPAALTVRQPAVASCHGLCACSTGSGSTPARAGIAFL